MVNWRQWLFYFVLCPLAVAACFIRDWKIAYTALTFTLSAFYGVVVLFRLASVGMALLRRSEHQVSAEEIGALRDEELPVYTILVPMYKEPEVAQKIARTVTHLNYPADKLDIKILLEEDDAPTLAKIDAMKDSLPSCVEIIKAPRVLKGEPRTKPRACNWGLDMARGEFLVIFDAEDLPEADQLKKAVITFRRLKERKKDSVVCLQAKLNYFNSRQNWLTRFFTLEYTAWFDLFLPGLHAFRSPIPLGGTSNHFKTEVLKEIGGWDPFNVTEDCDLGIRLTRGGCATEILDSTTWEEANSATGNWIRQRSRWVKGYFQTHLVHTRDAWLPMLAVALVFLLLTRVLGRDLADPRMVENIAVVAFLQRLCMVGAIVSGVCALYSVMRSFKKRLSSGAGVRLNLWKELTFRITVGGLSAMLLLNIVFWGMTSAYLLRKPLATVLPAAIGERQLDENSTVRQALRGWELYHTEVTDDKFEGATFWNTLSGYMGRRLNWGEAAERFNAIDTWSLVSQLFYPVAIMLFAGNFIIVLLGLISCQRRKLWDLLPYALLMPFYWVLISIAALKGFIQLFTNPWYWEKTRHGLVKAPPVETAGTAAGE